ncbi:MAG: ribosomal protein S18-alanine N-acetyltransferase [Actinomycetota bacterium]|nr:ribosomal protein S18-alanine N-acetyltransferase [Actinomycetota bacterium]
MSVLARLLGRADGGGLVIEPLRRRHMAHVLPIERVSYPRPWTVGVFHSEIEMMRRGERHYLVARDGTEVVGYGGLMFVVGDAHVTNIAVAPERQRQGIATRLLAELAWAAIDRDCTALTLEVRVSNVGAQALYRTFGFVPAGVRRNYYENVEDAIVMWCNDLALPEYRDLLRELCPAVGR